MNWIKKLFARIGGMSRPAYLILKGSIIITAIYLVAAIVVLAGTEDLNPGTYHAYAMAEYLYTTPQGILIAAIIGSVCIEDAVI
jgi:hypothetical protein